MRASAELKSTLQAGWSRLFASNARFVRAVSIYGLGQIALKGLDVLVFAVLVRALAREELGLVGAVTLGGYVITEIVSLGLFRSAIPRFILDGPDIREKVLSAGLGAFMAYAGGIGLVLLLLPHGASVLAGVGEHDLALRIFALSFVLRTFVVMELEILRMDHHAFRQALLEATPSALNLLGVLALIPLFSNDVLAASIASLASQALPFLVFFLLSMRRRRPSFEMLPELLRFSGPTVIHRTLADINILASRWIVLLAAGLSATGTYTFLIRIGDMLRLAQAPLTKAWTPAVLTAERDGDAGPARRATMALLVISTLTFLAALPIAPWLARLIDPQGKYADTYGVIDVVLFAGWLLTFQQVFGIGFLVAKRPGRVAPLTAIAAAINVVGSFVLLKAFGVLAVPYAAVTSNAAFALLSAYYGRRYFAIGSQRLTWVSLACLTVGCAGYLLAEVFG